jgi:hypothetical protein
MISLLSIFNGELVSIKRHWSLIRLTKSEKIPFWRYFLWSISKIRYTKKTVPYAARLKTYSPWVINWSEKIVINSVATIEARMSTKLLSLAFNFSWSGIKGSRMSYGGTCMVNFFSMTEWAGSGISYSVTKLFCSSSNIRLSTVSSTLLNDWLLSTSYSMEFSFLGEFSFLRESCSFSKYSNTVLDTRVSEIWRFTRLTFKSTSF